MLDAALPLSSTRPTPAFLPVFSEQLGLIGRALWREAAILGAVFVLFTILAVYEIFQHRMQVDFPAESTPLIAGFALLTGFAVWRGERLFDQGHILTLPVARQTHLLIRTLAGGVWLAGIIAWGMLWLAAMGLLSGGDLGFDRYLLLRPPGPEGQVALDDVRKIRWTPQTWHWLSAFTTAAIFYLLGCAFAIGARFKLRWAAVAVGLVVSMATNPFGLGDIMIEALFMDPLGLDNLMTGGLERAESGVILPGGKQVTAWTYVPGVRAWATATGAWLALGGALLWLAAWRHRER
jgi:hypothetical protein